MLHLTLATNLAPFQTRSSLLRQLQRSPRHIPVIPQSVQVVGTEHTCLCLSSYSITLVSDRAKIVFRSADQDYFALDRKDVEAHTGALLPDDESSRSMIDLPETSTILRTLFEFIGARKHPKLLNEKFDLLAEVAKAAEKYKIFSAMNTCSERMRCVLVHDPKARRP